MSESPRHLSTQALHRGRRAVGEVLDPDGLTLIGCSGGADSLALAALASWWAHHPDDADRSDPGAIRNRRIGAIVVNHHLHPGSVAVSGRAVTALKSLGLDPVRIVTASVDPHSADGPEAAARTGRYRAFRQAMSEHGSTRMLLGHTRDDQAEQVLLGLMRGSGTRSLAGIPAQRGPYRRPILDLSRAETEAICAHHGLSWWNDPANADPRYLRSTIRHQVMPLLTEQLGGSIVDGLTRTAQIAAADAEYLESSAKKVFAELIDGPDDTGSLRLPLTQLQQQPPAITSRVLALAVVATGVPAPSFERIAAVTALMNGSQSAGPVQLEGHLHVYRGKRDTINYGKLIFVPAHLQERLG